MTSMESDDLLNSSQYETFSSLDASWFLGAVGNVIKTYCNWHIFPVASQTITARLWAPTGKILLPSLKVLSVESIVDWRGNTWDSSQYTVHESGWIQYNSEYGLAWFGRGFGRTEWPQIPQERYVTVSFTHGYAVLPPSVAEVGYEVAMRAIEKPSGITRQMNIGPYGFTFNRFGAYLDGEQRLRLTPYALQGVR